jgi:hypothetical protein
MSVPCRKIAIIETDGVETPETIGTDAAAFMGFDSYPVSDGEADDPIPQSNDRAGVFMTWNVFAIRGLVLPAMGQYFGIRSADGASLYLKEDFLETRFWNVLLNDP